MVKAATPPKPSVEMVSGNLPTLAASAAVYSSGGPRNPKTDRRQIAKGWQVEAYRHLKICGEARYSAVLFSNLAARAEIGVSEGNVLGNRVKWVNDGPEVEVFAEIAPTVRERKRLVRAFMIHWIVAGECYLIARDRVDTDPGYETDPRAPYWEIVGVTDLRKGANEIWETRHDNGNWIALRAADPIVRMWNPDPEDRREAWSPFLAMAPTLREIEYFTQHIFAQVRSRLMSAGVWFLPNNLTFPSPPPDAVEGGAEAIAAMNEAEQFMTALAAASMRFLDPDEPAFPTVVMADPDALDAVGQDKLIKFWSEIDEASMKLRSDAVRRFALGMDLPPEQVLGSSGLAVTGAGGSAGSVNHWGVWANEETTISNHVEPALDEFVDVLTVGVLRIAVDNTRKIIAYDTASLRSRQDRSKESMELYDRGWLKGEVMVRENGFDPENDIMDESEFKRWLLTKIAGGSATPEQVQESLRLLGLVLNVDVSGNTGTATGQPGRNNPPSLESHPYEGPPREQHDHSPAPFSALHASSEVLVLRALEKAGARLLNERKRGKDRDTRTPAHLAHLSASADTGEIDISFDFSLLATALGDRSTVEQARIAGALTKFCRRLYAEAVPYTRDGLIEALEGLS